MAWTNITKPSESSVATSVTTLAAAVQPFGLLIVITSTMGATSSVTGASITTGWTSLSKPTSSTWTAVAKPTSSTWTLVAKPT
jgi:hypothetical protein